MGLIKVFAANAVPYISELWDDYIRCGFTDEKTLIQRGNARIASDDESSSDNYVITEGSRFVVKAGQLMIVTNNDKIVDFTAEQGGYEYKSAGSPNMFCGNFGDALKKSFKETAENGGGRQANGLRVYFINTGEIPNNKFGFGNVPYRDRELGMPILLQGYGTYSFEITDPIVFYSSVRGNVAEKFMSSSIEHHLKTGIQNAMIPVMEKLGESGARYDQLSSRAGEIVSLLREQLSIQWETNRGIVIKGVAFNNIIPNDDSMEKIRQFREAASYSENRALTAAVSVNEHINTEPPEIENSFENLSENNWTCSCGMVNTMMFCPKCGSKKPDQIICKHCGLEIPAQFAGLKFCPGCGKER